jgi:hypothetical protein
MRLTRADHAARPWRIHEIARGFRVEDVWALPTPGGPDDFPLLVEGIAAGDPAQASRAVSVLWSIRERVGGLLGVDDAGSGVGARVPSLRERLPEDLRATRPPSFAALPFSPLYLTDDEFAAELANRTVHGVLHLGWVEDGNGRWRGQLAVLVKPNGALGMAYMAAIAPFRHTIVYPQLLKQIGRQWEARRLRG